MTWRAIERKNNQDIVLSKGELFEYLAKKFSFQLHSRIPSADWDSIAEGRI